MSITICFYNNKSALYNKIYRRHHIYLSTYVHVKNIKLFTVCKPIPQSVHRFSALRYRSMRN